MLHVRFHSQWLLLVSALTATSAWSQANYQAIPMGERAVGMGGAFTALSNDESGAYYNPAGPAFTRSNSLSLNINLYGLVFGRVESPIGGNPTSVNYSTLNLIPATSSSLFHLGSGTEQEPSPWVFCFNVFAPGNFSQQQRTIIEERISLKTSLSQRHLLAGPTLAVKLNEKWALGVSAFGSLNTVDSEVSLVGGSFDAKGVPTQIVDLSYSESSMNFGLAVSAGARFNATPTWSLGFSVRSPVFHLLGNSTTYVHGLAYATGDPNPSFGLKESQTRTRFEIPTKLSLGVAWSRPKSVTFSLDVTAHLPQTFVINDSTGAMHALQFTPNVALGFEGFVTDSFAIRAGLYTDLANVAPPDPEIDFAPDQINTVGATLTFSLIGESTSTSLGVIATYSAIQTLGYDFVNERAFVTQGHQGRLFIVIASSFAY